MIHNENEGPASSGVKKNKGRVLIAEDNDTIQKLLTKVLSGEGYEVECVDDGLRARKRLTESGFDMVLSDILMPGMDGIELLKEVRDHFGDIPVILITGNQSLDNAKEAIRWGAFDYITKPFHDLSSILHSVNRAVMKGRLQREKENLIQELDRKNIHLKNVVRELDRKNARLDLLVYDLEWAMNLGGFMTSETRTHNIIDKMNRGIFEIFDVSIWGVLLFNREGNSLVKVYKTRKTPENMDESLMQIVLRDFYRLTEESINPEKVKTLIHEEILSAASPKDKQYHSALLHMGDKNLGLLFIYSEFKEGFEKLKQHTLSLIASQLSAAIENTNLFKMLEDQNVELKKLSDFKDDILNIAAHDLRSPISVVRMTATLLRDYADKMTEEEKNESVNDIVEKSEHITLMLNEILDMAVIEKGQLELNAGEESLDTLIEECYKNVLPLARSKNIEMGCLLSGELPPVVIDRRKIAEVLDNLLSNAIKYTPPGGLVSLMANGDNGSVEVCVKDTGVGIKKEELEKLFKKFSRTSARPTGGESSFGLGLAIAKEIVELHHGRIWVESECGRGSSFYFSLPAGKTVKK